MVLTKDYNEVRHQLALKLMLSEVWNDIVWTRSYAKMLDVSVSVSSSIWAGEGVWGMLFQAFEYDIEFRLELQI